MRFAALLIGALAVPVHGQLPPNVYPEPVPRAGGTVLPADLAAAFSAGAPVLGIPDARTFFTDPLHTATRREGDFTLLVILAGFADSAEPSITTEQLQSLIFDGPSSRGTLPEYYDEVSGGRLRIRGTVSPWVRTNVTIRDAAGEQEGHGWIGERMRDYVAEAIRLADEYIDFGQFDNDGPDGVPNSGDDDGRVDGLAIKYAEVSGPCGGPAPWPHIGAAVDGEGEAIETQELTPAGQPIRALVYIADSAMDCTGQQPDGVEVLAHEFGHLIGLPDLYRLYDGRERENRAWTVGCFDLMAAGAWGCGTGPKTPHFGPTHFSPFMKWRLGWLDFVDVEYADHDEFVLEPAQTATTALRVRLAPNSLEWFVLEYRPQSGFDQFLPAGGVLVYHYDAFEGERPVPDGVSLPYWYHLVEADGDDALRRSEVAGGNRGVAADVFARDGTVASIDDGSTPSTRDHLGGTSTLTIHSIRVDAGVARVTLSVGTGLQLAERLLPGLSTALFPTEARLTFAGGTRPYTMTPIAGRLPDGMTATLEDDVLVVAGEPTEAGTFAHSFVITDATGRRIAEAVRLEIDDVAINPPDLIRALRLGESPLDTRTRSYLDRSGNRNGRYDVGDLRAYLQRTAQPR